MTRWTCSPGTARARGELQVAGPWIAREYYNDDRSPESFTADGWLKTGDVATVDPEGYIRLVDRTKDVVKSGGEWISSVELENEIMAHPEGRRGRGDRCPAPEVVRASARVRGRSTRGRRSPRRTSCSSSTVGWRKWWLPDDVVFIDEVPKTSVGKFSKKDLRDRFRDYQLPTT